MHPNIEHLLSLFATAHLPSHLGEIVERFRGVAVMTADLAAVKHPPSSNNVLAYGVGSEVGAALRKLVEAKDAAVRAQVCIDKLAVMTG